ncbi:uncharacterized protein [Palaemon carinicauda]|uniref:uncharacterized protein n=1 Tax=Palaemon carinicauda TaxID=392227 RepID=UPI0035B5F3AD
MAQRVTLPTFLLVVWMTLQLVTGPSQANAMDTWDNTINVINDGIDWVAEKVARYAMEGKLVKLEGSDNSIRNSRQLQKEEEAEAEITSEEDGLLDDAEGRLFIGTGLNGTGVSLNLQGLQAAIGTAIGVAIVIGIIVIIILIIIALATGRDIYSISKGFNNRFTDPYEEDWYAPNYNYNSYKDESTYTSYRALDEAAKKYEDNKE